MSLSISAIKHEHLAVCCHSVNACTIFDHATCSNTHTSIAHLTVYLCVYLMIYIQHPSTPAMIFGESVWTHRRLD